MNNAGLGVDPWDEHADWWQREFTEGADPEYVEQILPLIESRLPKAGCVLDVGCGEGQVTRLAVKAGLGAVGLDAAGAAVRGQTARSPTFDGRPRRCTRAWRGVCAGQRHGPSGRGCLDGDGGGVAGLRARPGVSPGPGRGGPGTRPRWTFPAVVEPSVVADPRLGVDRRPHSGATRAVLACRRLSDRGRHGGGGGARCLHQVLPSAVVVLPEHGHRRGTCPGANG